MLALAGKEAGQQSQGVEARSDEMSTYLFIIYLSIIGKEATGPKPGYLIEVATLKRPACGLVLVSTLGRLPAGPLPSKTAINLYRYPICVYLAFHMQWELNSAKKQTFNPRTEPTV